MHQLTYKLPNVDSFTHQLAQLGGQFLSKGPEREVYFRVPQHELRLVFGIRGELAVLQLHDHYQILSSMDAPEPELLRELLQQLHEERCELSKQVIRYHLQQVLIEIHRYGTGIGDMLCLIAPKLDTLKALARRLSLEDRDRITITPADMAL